MCLAMVGLMFVLGVSVEALEVQQTQSGKDELFTVSNAAFKAVFTTNGGRMKSLTDTALGRGVLFWTPGEGGMLDDKGTRTTAQYGFELLKQNKNEVQFCYTLKDSLDIFWRKTITIRDDDSSIRVDYSLNNQSGKDIIFNHMVRNFVIKRQVKGVPLQCLFNDENGLQSRAYNSWAPAQSIRVRKLPAGWLGVLCPETKLGLAVSVKKATTAYFWAAGGEDATLEWVVPYQIKKGETANAQVIITLTRDFDGYSNVGKHVVIHCAPFEDVKKFTFTTNIKPISEALKADNGVFLKTTLLDNNRNMLAEQPAEKIMANGKAVIIQKWKAPHDGRYIIQQQLVGTDKIYADYEMPLVCGFVNDKATYRHPLFPVPKEYLNLKLTKENLENGYFVHLPSYAGKTETLDELTVHAGVGEYEYVELNTTVLKDVGNAKISLELPSELKGKAHVYVEENYRILDKSEITLTPGQKNAFWLELDTKSVKPATYTVKLTVNPEKAEASVVKLNVQIWPVDLPEDTKPMCHIWWSGFSTIFGGGKLYHEVKDKAKMLRIWDEVVSDLRKVGNEIIEIRPGSSFSNRHAINEFVKVREFKNDYLPVLDVEGWDPILDIVKKHGIENAMFKYGWICPKWLPEGYKTMSKAKRDEIDFYILKQLYDHLKKRGFKRILWHCLDELNPDKIDGMVERIRKTRKVCPGLEFAGNGFMGTPLDGMQKIANELNWVAPYFSIHNVFDWINEGKLKLRKNTIVGSQIAGTFDSGYLKSRLFLWNMWQAGLNGYQVYGYHTHYPKDGYSFVFKGKERPVYSPVYFALIDGNEDFAYLLKLKSILQSLKDSGNDDRYNELSEELKTIIGWKNAILQLKTESANSAVYPVLQASPEDLYEAKGKLLKILAKDN